jgi:RNA polymerase sigma-70 factor, ECF subfamily
MAADVRIEIVAFLPRLRRFGRALTGSLAEADDLVQGACEKALASLDGYEPGTRLDSWLFRILRNLWIDQVRRKKFAPTEEVGDHHAGEDGRSIVEARSELDLVRGLIGTLPNEQREVLVLVCIEDQSYRDTAAILDIPIGTVMSRLSRARLALSAGLAGEGEGREKAFREKTS